MYYQYFLDWEVRFEFQKEYVSLWPNWLGKDRLHLIDAVTEQEWGRFNAFIEMVSKHHEVGLVDCNHETIDFPKNIKSTFSPYSESMNKDASLFSKYVLPKLDCVITEEWDYTYILWHKNNGALDLLIPYLTSCELQHFSDEK